jgi:mono/diheme cytochrome c family protein
MTSLMAALVIAVLGTALAGCATTSPAASPTSERGEYLVRIMDCAGCHTPGALAGKPEFDRNLAGSTIGFHLPGAGIFYPPNLTPDTATGLGRWTEPQIARAIRHGERPDGRRLVPLMPWPSYSALTDADVAAIATYLKTLRPIANAVPRPVPEGQPAPAPYLDLVVPR